MRCPCRKKSETIAYAACCEPYHKGPSAAPTAEALMRSRYCAYVRGDEDYLRATWHPATRPRVIETETQRVWMLLKVLHTRETGDTAVVEFRAQSQLGGRTHVLHEISRFVREDGRWLYVDGRML